MSKAARLFGKIAPIMTYILLAAGGALAATNGITITDGGVGTG